MIRELFLRDLSLWAVVWQSILFAFIGLVGSFLLRRRPARASQVLLLALIAAVTVPAMGVLVKHFELGLFVAEPIQSEVEMPHEFVPTVYETSEATSHHADIANEIHERAEGPVLVEAGSARAHIPWRLIVLYGWMTATLILLGRLSVDVVNGILLLRRAQSRVSGHIERAADSARARLGITKTLQIRSSKDMSSPVIWCWSPIPVLLVPTDLDDGLDWVSVICHELAHWRRRDHISGLVAELIVCILPWNPLLWWSKKRMVRFSEQACDDWVVAGGQSVEDYAQSLLNFRPQKQMAFVPAVVSSKKTLAGRVRRIVEERCKSPDIGLRWSLTAAAIAGCIAVGIAFAQTRPPRSTGTVKTKISQSAVIEQPASAMIIKGHVLDSDNKPAFARVIALPNTSYGAEIRTNNKEGYFELSWSPTWLDEGQPIYLIAKSGHYTPTGGTRKDEAAIVEVTDLTQPVDPAKPADTEQGPNPDLAKEFHDIYRLDEQELIKFIKPPFVLGRQEYLLTTPHYPSFALQHPGHHYGFRWDNELKMYSSFSARQLSWVLYFVLGIPEYDFNLPKELKVDLLGDWIVRAGLPIAQQLKALEEIIYAETNRAIRFEKRTIEREVIVAKGRYEFKPHPSGNYPNYIPLWDGRLQSSEYTVDSLERLFGDIEFQIKMEIVDETEPAEIATIRFKWVKRDPEPTGDKLSALLDDLAKTTSLQFKIERRPAQIWFVTEIKEN